MAQPTTPELTPAREPALSVVIVNYNSWREVARQINDLGQALEVRSGRVEVIVVDNASPHPAPTTLESLPHGIRLKRSPENGGFSAGVNVGWRLAEGRWILVLNPDVLTPTDLPRQVMDRIASYEARKDRAAPGIVGFALANLDGSRQPSVGHDPSLTRLLRGLFLPRKLRKYQPVSKVRPGSVPWVTGACFLVQSELLRRLGGMDEEFFLYYEEVALCVAARRLGYQVEYDPEVSVVHCHPLQNRRLTPSLRLITRHSQLLFFRKYASRAEFEALARIVELEASLRGMRTQGQEARVNKEVRSVASRMRGGEVILGRAIRDRVAELGLAPECEPAAVLSTGSEEVVPHATDLPGQQQPFPGAG